MENEERFAVLQARMAEAQIDLIAIGPTANMRYLLGFTPHADERLCLLLVGRQNVFMLVPALNYEQVAARMDVPLLVWEDADGPKEALRESLANYQPLGALAVDGVMRADHLLQLQAAATPKKTLLADDILFSMRLYKSAEEIEALSRAAAQADRAMQAAVEACRPGITEAEVAWAAEAAFRQDGAEQVCFTLVASGPNGAYPHHHSGERKLQKGEGIIIDIGASLNGYKSDITRMVYLGEPPKDLLSAHAAVLEANLGSIAAVQPGKTTGEIDRIARNILEEAGYGPYFVHRTGHGIGLEGHEPPWIMEGDSTVLQDGMVFSIEPGVYLPGKFGVRIEDIVTVTQSGVVDLTGFDKSLIIKD